MNTKNQEKQLSIELKTQNKNEEEIVIVDESKDKSLAVYLFHALVEVDKLLTKTVLFPTLIVTSTFFTFHFFNGTLPELEKNVQNSVEYIKEHLK